MRFGALDPSGPILKADLSQLALSLNFFLHDGGFPVRVPF